MLRNIPRVARIAALVITAVLLTTWLSPASASNEGQVCSGNKIDVSGNVKSIVVTAPEGKLISGFCVKAGSINQGLGPEYEYYNPPVKTVTITHSSGKDISHYSVTFVDKTPSTTPPTEPPKDACPDADHPGNQTSTSECTNVDVPPNIIERGPPATPVVTPPAFTG